MLEIAKQAMNSYLDYRLNPQDDKPSLQNQKILPDRRKSDINEVKGKSKTPLIR